jgi:hypothetical protein
MSGVNTDLVILGNTTNFLTIFIFPLSRFLQGEIPPSGLSNDQSVGIIIALTSCLGIALSATHSREDCPSLITRITNILWQVWASYQGKISCLCWRLSDRDRRFPRHITRRLTAC